MVFLLCFLPVHSCAPTVLPARDLRDTQKLQEGARKPPSVIRQELEMPQGRFGGWGTPLFQKGFIARAPLLPGLEGRAQSVGVERAEEQRRREDKPVVICLFNWLKSSEESCAVIRY